MTKSKIDARQADDLKVNGCGAHINEFQNRKNYKEKRASAG